MTSVVIFGGPSVAPHLVAAQLCASGLGPIQAHLVAGVIGTDNSSKAPVDGWLELGALCLVLCNIGCQSFDVPDGDDELKCWIAGAPACGDCIDLIR